MLTLVVAEGVAILLLAVLVLGLLRSHGLILRALHELGAGLELETAAERTATSGADAAAATPGPVAVTLERGVVPASRPVTAAADIEGTTLDGRAATVAVSGRGRRTLLAFLSSGCTVCQTFWDEFAARPGQDVPGHARLAVVTKGPEQESTSRLRQLAGDGLEVVQSSTAWDGYEVPGSPYFVYVEDGVITGEGSSTTWTQVRDLMGQAVDDTTEARRRAGRSGPGLVGGLPGSATEPAAESFAHTTAHTLAQPDAQPGDRDDPVRMDRELLAAGIRPGHPSMYEHPESGPAADHEAGPDGSR